ncbi:MAG: hypothetical protein K8F25_19745, partial [Fimbriimonadaceae bacterium]|nr:hypothetical protein [Alphaproteobacteria bacterium]
MNLLYHDKRVGVEFMRNTAAKSSHVVDPIDAIFQIHDLNAQMCAALEEIADGLPNRIDRALCAKAVAMIGLQIPLHRYNEEKCLFPLLLEHADCEPGLGEIVAHLS